MTNTPALPSASTELAAIRDLCVGRVEWRCSREDGAYCMSFDSDNSRDPEREANEWLARHQRDYPHRFMEYSVCRVVVQSQLQEEALALLSRLSDAQAEIQALRADARRYRAIRAAGSQIKLYCYDDPNDCCSGDWHYKPTEEEVDKWCDAALSASGEGA